MQYYFERQRSASAALAPESVNTEELMGNDVKRFLVDESAKVTNGQLAARFESRSLWLDPSVDGAIIPYKIHQKLSTQCY